MSAMCDADVAIIMFGPDGELSQFSSSSMEETLRAYSRNCTQIHEVQTRDHLLNKRIHKSKSSASRDDDHGGVVVRQAGGNKRSRFAPQHSLSNGREGTWHNNEKETRDTAEAMLAMTRGGGAGGLGDAGDDSSQTISMNGGEEGDMERCVSGTAMVESMEREIDKIRAKKAAAAKSNESLKIKQEAKKEDTNNPSMEPFEALAAVLAGAPLHCDTPKHDSAETSQERPKVTDNEKNTVLNTPAVKITPPVAASLEAPPPLGLNAREPDHAE